MKSKLKCNILEYCDWIKKHKTKLQQPTQKPTKKIKRIESMKNKHRYTVKNNNLEKKFN